MAPRLPDGAKRDIAAVITSLPPDLPVTPGDALMIAAIVCEREVNRQTLWCSEEIKDAVASHAMRHEAWRAARNGSPAKTALQQALATIKALRAEILERDAILDGYHEMLARHLQNARDRRLSVEDMEAPLAKVVRGAPRSTQKKWNRALRQATGRH